MEIGLMESEEKHGQPIGIYDGIINESKDSSFRQRSYSAGGIIRNKKNNKKRATSIQQQIASIALVNYHDIKMSEKDTESLTNQIEKIYKEEKNYETQLRKLYLRHNIYVTLLNSMKTKVDLCVIGSTFTGFDTLYSDLDLCLILYDSSGKQIDNDYRNHKSNEIEKLHVVSNILKENACFSQIEVIKARTPILKFMYNSSDFEINLNINHINSVENTYLLRIYSDLDPRVKAMMVVIKTWARVNQINDPFRNSLSSFSWTLLIIHFLQSGCHPPVLPYLQQKYPNLLDSLIDFKVPSTIIPQHIHYQSENNQSVGQLLIQFFEYYTWNVNFTQYIISIRETGLVERAQALAGNTHSGPFGLIYIEEPISKANTAYCVKDVQVYVRILNEFRRAWFLLKKHGAEGLKLLIN